MLSVKFIVVMPSVVMRSVIFASLVAPIWTSQVDEERGEKLFNCLSLLMIPHLALNFILNDYHLLTVAVTQEDISERLGI